MALGRSAGATTPDHRHPVDQVPPVGKLAVLGRQAPADEAGACSRIRVFPWPQQGKLYAFHENQRIAHERWTQRTGPSRARDKP